jgi:type IV secretion system protein VirB10
MSGTSSGHNRSVSPVAAASRRFRFSRRQKTLMVLGVTGAVVAFVFWKNPGHKPEQPAKPESVRIAQVAAYEPPPMPKPVTYRPTIAPPAERAPLLNQVVRQTATGKAQSPDEYLNFSVQEPLPSSAHSAAANKPADADTPYPIAFKGQQFPGAKTGPAVDPTYTLMPGLYHCVLDTAIDSSIPGPFQCHTTKPIMSENGVVLMGAGTKIWGAYQSANGASQGRLVSITAMAQTPDNVFVPLDGPAADGLGRTGIPGNQDNHTFQRFGGAVLLALSSNVASVLSSALSKSGSTYLNINTGDLTSLASEILRDTINIPPTITVWQGTDVAIWIRYPIDFSASYRLRPINAVQ